MRLRPLPALLDNYIWLLDDGEDAIAVDPGEAGPLLEELANKRLRLTTILLTHHHADHVGGVAELLRSHPGAKVFAPRDDVEAFAWLRAWKDTFRTPVS